MKKLLVIAIAVAVSAPALADVKLYGQLHASYDALSGATDINTVASNSSRIGVKGSTELGDSGLKGIYKAEWGIDTGNGNDPVFKKRNQFVGVAGGFGSLTIGRNDTPFKKVGRKADLFWSSQLGQNRSLTNAGMWDKRLNNAITYTTPKMGGLQGKIAYFTDNDDGTDNNSVVSLNGFYTSGPLLVGLGYETHDYDGAQDENALRLMASYKLGATKLVAFYQDETNGGAIKPNTTDASVIGLGVAHKLGAGTIKAQWYERDNDGTDTDPTLIAVGYDHKVAKKTQAYIQYATVSDGSIGGSGHGEKIGPDAGGDAGGVSVGIRLKF